MYVFLWSLWKNRFLDITWIISIFRENGDHFEKIFLAHISKNTNISRKNSPFLRSLWKIFFSPYLWKYKYSRKKTFFRTHFLPMCPNISTFQWKGLYFAITLKNSFFCSQKIFFFFAMKKSCFGLNSHNINVSIKRTLLWDFFEKIVSLAIKGCFFVVTVIKSLFWT